MFRVYRDDQGHWCASRDDGLVGGIFCDRAEAERFARSEEQLGQSAPRRTGVAEVTSTGSSAMEALAGKTPAKVAPNRSSVHFVDFRSSPLTRQG